MNRIVLYLLISLLLVSCGTSKSVSYSHKPLAEEGCRVSYAVLEQEGQLQIIATVKSDRLVFSDDPIMMLRNFNGEVLRLNGKCLQSRTETGGIIINNMVLPVSELNAMALFPVSEDDIDFFLPGIAKVRLSTLPIVHEKSFSRDVIGSYLFRELKRALTTKDDF
jgi:hypothetical protein